MTATTTTLAAIPAEDRQDGVLCAVTDGKRVFMFVAGDATAPSTIVIAPSVGTGRWFDVGVSDADLSAVTAAAGIGSNAAGHVSATVAGQLAEDRALIDAGMQVQKKTLTATHATLVAAAALEVVNIGTALPANSRIIAVEMHTFAPFTGGTIGDFTCDVGMAADDNALVAAANLFAAAVDGVPSTMAAGIAPQKFYAAGGQLIATFRCGSDDVADAGAGNVTIDVLYVVLA